MNLLLPSFRIFTGKVHNRSSLPFQGIVVGQYVELFLTLQAHAHPFFHHRKGRRFEVFIAGLIPAAVSHFIQMQESVISTNYFPEFMQIGKLY